MRLLVQHHRSTIDRLLLPESHRPKLLISRMIRDLACALLRLQRFDVIGQICNAHVHHRLGSFPVMERAEKIAPDGHFLGTMGRSFYSKPQDGLNVISGILSTIVFGQLGQIGRRFLQR